MTAHKIIVMASHLYVLVCLHQTCSFLKGTSVQWIDSQKVPYAVKGNQWVGFDNQRSYDAKVQYISLWKRNNVLTSPSMQVHSLISTQGKITCMGSMINLLCLFKDFAMLICAMELCLLPVVLELRLTKL